MTKIEKLDELLGETALLFVGVKRQLAAADRLAVLADEAASALDAIAAIEQREGSTVHDLKALRDQLEEAVADYHDMNKE